MNQLLYTEWKEGWCFWSFLLETVFSIPFESQSVSSLCKWYLDCEDWKVQVSVKRVADIVRGSCLIICEMREREGCLAPLHGQLPCSQRWQPEKGGKKPFKDISPEWDKNESNRES